MIHGSYNCMTRSRTQVFPIMLEGRPCQHCCEMASIVFSSVLCCAGRGRGGDGLCSAIKMVRRRNTKTRQAESLRLRGGGSQEIGRQEK